MKYIIFFVCVALLISCGDGTSNSNPIKTIVEDSSSSCQMEDVSSNSVSISSSKVSSDSRKSSGGKMTSSSSSRASSDSRKSSGGKMTSSSSSRASSDSRKSSGGEMTSSSSSRASSDSRKSSGGGGESLSSSSSEKIMEMSSSEQESSSSYAEISSSSLLVIPSKIYDCNIYNCVSTTYLNPDVDYGELLDTRDNQVYRTVEIGNQIWMAQNLNYKTERSFCWKNNEDSCLIYGRYYPFSVAMDSINQGGCGYGEGCKKNERHQGICPDDWHLPDSLEIAQFLSYIRNRYGSDSVYAIKSTFTWKSAYTGTNASGFSLLYAGRVIFGSDGYHSSDNKLDKAYIWGNGWTKIESNGFDHYFGGTFGIQQNILFFLYEFDENTVVWGLDMIDKDAYNIRCLKDD